MAVKEGHKEIVEYLVKRKADLNSKDTKGVSTYMTILTHCTREATLVAQ